MMTTALLDTSLDVNRRLADLRTWQAEWQHIDQKLEEQLIPLSGKNLLELQQAVHISNTRRRMAMTLVKQPLSIPESVLTAAFVKYDNKRSDGSDEAPWEVDPRPRV